METKLKMNQNIHWERDVSGVVQGPGLHDGNLSGIAMKSDKILVIMAKNYKGERLHIELTNVTALRVTNFLEGNIIGNIWFWKIHEISKDKWGKLYEYHLTSHNRVDDLQKIIAQNQNSHFFMLDSSYGAEIYATCNGMSMYQV